MAQPTLFIPHGGGPWPWVPRLRQAHAELEAHLSALPATLPAPPRALLVVSAHWEAPVATVSTAARPGMLYDYYNFPAATYQVKYGAPGAPDLAETVQGLLQSAGVATATDASRGFDHGTFVPLAVAWPDADVPVLQLSLMAGLDPQAHLDVGRALAPLREDGVLIVGSGLSYHNLPGFFGRVPTKAVDSEAFDAWLSHTVAADPATRAERLRAWSQAPGARASHPREEHLLPLMVAAGAALASPGAVTWRRPLMGATVSSVRFG